jgi:hypothetical protein
MAMMDAADVAWEKELNDLEKVLKQCLECRTKKRIDERLTLRLAFKAFDTDNSGEVCYREFVRALEKFGLVASQQVRGLFDRYASMDMSKESLSYEEFSRGLFGPVEHKPQPQPRKDAHSWGLDGDAQLRQSPANRWANSTEDLSPNQRPLRQMSIANPKHRDQKPPTWERDEYGGWRQV